MTAKLTPTAKVGHDVRCVFYNDGSSHDLFAIALKDPGGHVLDLLYCNAQGVWAYEYAVPQREKADYGPEGGGRTYHL